MLCTLGAPGDVWYAKADAVWSALPTNPPSTHDSLTEGDLLVELGPEDVSHAVLPKDRCGPLATLVPDEYLRVRWASEPSHRSRVGYVSKAAVGRRAPRTGSRVLALEAMVVARLGFLRTHVFPFDDYRLAAAHWQRELQALDAGAPGHALAREQFGLNADVLARWSDGGVPQADLRGFDGRHVLVEAVLDVRDAVAELRRLHAASAARLDRELHTVCDGLRTSVREPELLDPACSN